jgi:hypothetical protein
MLPFTTVGFLSSAGLFVKGLNRPASAKAPSEDQPRPCLTRSVEREFVILPGESHSIALGLHHHQFWHVVRSFLEMPKRMDVRKQK